MEGKYVYPGSREEFFSEYGGLPRRGLSLGNIFLIFVVILIVIIVITAIGLILSKTTTVYRDRDTYFNLDLLLDLNNVTTTCCVRPGTTVPDETYVYDTNSGVTYARDRPNDIQTVCNSFPDPETCLSQNTNASGEIIPIATFKAKPYYVFENGLFIGCSSTTTCL